VRSSSSSESESNSESESTSESETGVVAYSGEGVLRPTWETRNVHVSLPLVTRSTWLRADP